MKEYRLTRGTVGRKEAAAAKGSPIRGGGFGILFDSKGGGTDLLLRCAVARFFEANGGA
jgi:hypothetical protein